MPRKKMIRRADGYYKLTYKDKQFYGKTIKEAQAKLDEYKRMEQAEIDVLSHDRSEFLQYSKHWVEVFRAGCNPCQRKQYMNMVEYSAERLPVFMKDITMQDIQKVVNSLSDYSPSHVSKYMTTLRGIFSTATAEGVLLRNPMSSIKRPNCKKVEGHRALEPWERVLIRTTWAEHDFGPAAMVMMYAGLRRGEVLHIDIDRDVDFEKKTISVNGAVSFPTGHDPVVTKGKTEAAIRSIPLVRPLEEALQGKHGLLLTKDGGGLMTYAAFVRKYESYMTFLETKLNGCPKRWYGKTKEHKELLAKGEELPPWREVKIRCHDFRVDFCTRNYEAGIPIKTLEKWMGHSDAQMIMKIYTKLTEEQEKADALKLMRFMEEEAAPPKKRGRGRPKKEKSGYEK